MGASCCAQLLKSGKTSLELENHYIHFLGETDSLLSPSLQIRHQPKSPFDSLTAAWERRYIQERE